MLKTDFNNAINRNIPFVPLRHAQAQTCTKITALIAYNSLYYIILYFEIRNPTSYIYYLNNIILD